MKYVWFVVIGGLFLFFLLTAGYLWVDSVQTNRDRKHKRINNDRKWEEQQQIQKIRQQEEAKRQMFMEFIQTYPDVKADQIPQEVWQMVLQKGYPLTAAYAIWENKQLKQQTLGG